MNRWPLVASAAAALLLVALANRRREILGLVASSSEPAPVEPSADADQAGAELELEAGQGGDGSALWTLETLLASIDPATYLSAPVDTDTADANVRAFLAMIRVAEGTADANGYRALFGHRPSRPRLFDGWADHPRVAQQFTDKAGRRLWTSAAGAYQFMAVSPIPTGGSTKVNTWDRLQAKLQLPDFSPASQDLAALELVREAGALADVRAGRFADAVAKVRRIWASLPGAGYDQAERALEDLELAFVNAGGTLAA